MEKALKFLLWTVGIFAAIVGLGRAFFFEFWTVPMDPVLATSLAPTLFGGDYVLVSTREEIEFGDLVRCTDPDDGNMYAVGRVLGLPGDTVKISAGVLTVNSMRYVSSEACKESKLEVMDPDSDTPIQIRCSRVELGNNWHFMGQSEKPELHEVKHETSTNHYFLLSDNRDIHDDSRDFGEIPVENCKNRIFFRLWPKEGWFDDKRLTFIR